MSDETQGPDGPPPDVGSVGEEAAKLLGALSGWTSAHGWSSAVETLVADVNDHVATGGEDCRYCPVCQLIHAARSTSPEVKEQLSTAATSLLQAAAGLLATQVPKPEKNAGPKKVEKIDLSNDWEEER
ncbi:MAG: hypothetical protein ACR2FG_08325 [Marmoricola sp.]